MKIVDIVCSAGRTGFYFDDQRAIKGGAGHDGVFYVGQPVTEGFRAVRQAGESISVMIVLEDGQIAYGDCAAVQYSGAGGRDPLFLAEDFIPVIDKYIKPQLVGREADNFRELAAMMEAIQVDGKRLHTAIRYGQDQCRNHKCHKWTHPFCNFQTFTFVCFCNKFIPAPSITRYTE